MSRSLLGVTFMVLFFCLFSCSERGLEEEKSIDSESPRVQSFTLPASQNSTLLIEDIQGDIIGDSLITCWVPNLVPNKLFKATIDATSDVYINGERYTSQTVFDLSKPSSLTVVNGEQKKEYKLYVHAFTGLPVMWIETVDRQEITSREEYLRASFRLVEDVKTRAAGETTTDSVSIRGRGNSSWIMMPKKPYRLKLDNKQALLGEASDKSWVLVNNYADKTMLRNATVLYMSSISQLEYTPSAHFVELMLNGQYNGTYQLCDKIKISKNRVNVGDDGFLLEIDANAASDDVTFTVSHLDFPVNIKEPEVKLDDENYKYIMEYIEAADRALFSDNFKDNNNGWQRYLDIESFVDWYLINEICKNNDAALFTSCYMNLSRGGKLKMGPVWDYDLSFGNVDYNENWAPDGFWIKNTPWFSRLFEDPVFVARVKDRFEYYYAKKSDILREMNENAVYLKYAIQENENRWHTFYKYTWPNYDIWGSYCNEIQSLKDWFSTRLEWLKAEYAAL